MKKTSLILFVLLITLFMGATGFTANFQKGMNAAKRGDYETAIREWKPLAERGDVKASYYMGRIYRLGKGVPKDYERAFELFKFAAKKGNLRAQNNLAVMYSKGQGVVQDYIFAHMWWSIAASHGSKEGYKYKGIVEKVMAPYEIKKAQKLARECVENNYEGC